jgi:hypothetical protein
MAWSAIQYLFHGRGRPPSAGTTRARAVLAAGFRRCCRGTGRFDGTQGSYYVRDREQ